MSQDYFRLVAGHSARASGHADESQPGSLRPGLE